MATNSPNLISLPSARPETGVFYPANDSQIASAISRAQENLLGQQKPDGHWCGELYVDSTLCSDYVLYMHWLGEVDRELQERCTQHILRRQLPDGGWNIYFGGPSEINASVKAYFALKLAGYSADLPFMREARANILRLGGVPRVNTFSKLYLALLGQFPWKYLPTIPVEMILLPTWAPFHIYKMSSWSRAMLVPLAIINHFKPTRELPGEKQLHELYPLGTEHKDFRLPRDERTFTWRNLFLRGDDTLKMLHRIPWKPFRRLALEDVPQHLLGFLIATLGQQRPGLAQAAEAGLTPCGRRAAKTADRLVAVTQFVDECAGAEPRLSQGWEQLSGAVVGDDGPAKVAQLLQGDSQAEICIGVARVAGDGLLQCRDALEEVDLGIHAYPV